MLTLVVPVFNMERFLPRCMAAFYKQTSKDFEIVLVDDGSTDQSPAMCDQYAAAHPDLIRVVHKPNGGLSSARNAGIDAAFGEYVIFPDPDDWVEPDYVASLLNLQREYHADLICTGYSIDYDDRSIPAGENCEPICMDQCTAQDTLLLPPCMGGFAWNKLYRLDIIRKNGLRFLDDVGTTEDLDFVFRYLGYCETAVFAPAIRSYHYYQRDGAATRSGFSKKKMGSMNTYAKIIHACGDQHPELIRAAKEEICTTAVNLLWMHQNAHSNDYDAKKALIAHIRTNLPVYLFSKRYGLGRKMQAVLAGYFPSIYVKLKNTVRKNK